MQLMVGRVVCCTRRDAERRTPLKPWLGAVPRHSSLHRSNRSTGSIWPAAAGMLRSPSQPFVATPLVCEGMGQYRAGGRLGDKCRPNAPLSCDFRGLARALMCFANSSKSHSPPQGGEDPDCGFGGRGRRCRPRPVRPARWCGARLCHCCARGRCVRPLQSQRFAAGG